MKVITVIILIAVAGVATWMIFSSKGDSNGSLSYDSGSGSLYLNDSSGNNQNMENQNSQNEDQIDTSSLPEKITATIKTNEGDIELELYPKVAPKTVANFINLSGSGFYDGTKFHRVVPGFVIQGGDPLSKDDDPSNDGTGGPGYNFEDEINPKSLGLSDEAIAGLEAEGYKYNYNLESLPVTAGAIAMANAGPNTNGSQFFIVTDEDQPHLNGRHTVFGKVVSGMDVVKKIKQGDKILEVNTDLN